ncbi:MAG: hypothetical protein H7A05_09795 [Pseudomonadales bacterium]|nr:hypothetical protein [Pseudomonadales bacterium]MCP5344902.1 hypothetical protein [Pseudomonadales bacterium]
MSDKPEHRDEALERAIAALPRERQPGHDLWPALEARLTPRQSAWQGLAPWAAAAAIVLAAAGLWFQNLPAPPVAQNSAPSPLLGGGDPVAELLSTYEREKGSQLASLPVSSPAIKRQLAVWDAAVGQVRQALQYAPGEPHLLAQLDRLYRQQLRYLEQLATIDPELIAYY